MKPSKRKRDIAIGSALWVGSAAVAVMTHHVANWLWFTVPYAATVIVGGYVIRWHARRKVRRILAEKPYLAYLVAIRETFGKEDNA